MSGACTGYHWSHGQYTLSNCKQESSTFFIILGFTMLVLLILLGLILVIACFRRQRSPNQAQASADGRAAGSQDNCIVQVDDLGTGGGQLYGKNLDSVKCVIMAGEDKPTFLAHPVVSFHPKTHEDEDGHVEPEDEGLGETSKQEQQDERV